MNPDAPADALHIQNRWVYRFIGNGGSRLICSWATADAQIKALIDEVKAVAAAPSPVPAEAIHSDTRSSDVAWRTMKQVCQRRIWTGVCMAPCEEPVNTRDGLSVYSA